MSHGKHEGLKKTEFLTKSTDRLTKIESVSEGFQAVDGEAFFRIILQLDFVLKKVA